MTWAAAPPCALSHRRAPKKEKKEFTPVAPGSYNSAAIIMLTDGQRTTGVDPLEAAKMAADRGVRVYTVGVGTVDGETIGFEGWSMRVRLDEDTLKAVACRPRPNTFYAGTAADLKKVYEKRSAPPDGGEEGNRDLRPAGAGGGGAGAGVGRPVAAVVQPMADGRIVREAGQCRAAGGEGVALVKRLKAIHRKALRDLWHMRGQALAIALVIASGIAMLVMSRRHTQFAGQDTRDRLYARLPLRGPVGPGSSGRRNALAQGGSRSCPASPRWKPG
jgi:hypothetical protein